MLVEIKSPLAAERRSVIVASSVEVSCSAWIVPEKVPLTAEVIEPSDRVNTPSDIVPVVSKLPEPISTLELEYTCL